MLLDGLRIVSFCHYLQGPAACQYLADLGAEVVKIEAPGGNYERRWKGGNPYVGGVSAFFLCANRNQRSLSIDLKHPSARGVIDRLIDRSHAVIENFRPGVLERLGFGYAAVRERKPSIIYASATGWGASGPMRDRPGQDLLAQAFTGMIAATGERETKPTPIGNAAMDQHGAALLALGVAAAYARLLATGEGTRVEASLLNAGIDLQMEPLTLYFSGGADRAAFRRDPHLASWYHEAPYGVYRMQDGFVAISLNDPLRLAEAFKSERLRSLAHLDRFEDRDACAAALAEELSTRRLAEHAADLDRLGIWYAPVRDYDDLAEDPQVAHCEIFRKVDVRGETAVLVNHPLRYDGEVPPLRHLALDCGQDTRAILAEAGYSGAEIDALVADQAVFVPPAAADGTS